jgi:hypothetical protein
MRRIHHRRTGGVDGANGFEQKVPRLGIDAHRGLVEKEQPRAIEQPERDTEAAFHAT